LSPGAPPLEDAHLWLADPGAFSEAALLRHAYLTDEERARGERYVFPEDRRAYLLTRALARAALSHAAPGVEPREWTFAVGSHGKPSISGPRALPLEFNLSNTRTLVACLVATGGPVGVDVEDESRELAPDELADRFFSPSEASGLRALPPEARHARFLELWTLKESYIKARGLGLSIPLEQFSFVLDSPPIRIELAPRLEDDPARWQFALLRPTARHVLAATLSRTTAGERRLVMRWLVGDDLR
jgi:4'-phosphopantetheinyl transferase